MRIFLQCMANELADAADEGGQVWLAAALSMETSIKLIELQNLQLPLALGNSMAITFA